VKNNAKDMIKMSQLMT